MQSADTGTDDTAGTLIVELLADTSPPSTTHV
jgi:hypothetical protein